MTTIRPHKLSHLLLALATVMFCQTIYANSTSHVYKWVDETGAVQYSQHPPKNAKGSTKLEVSTQMPTTTPPTAPQAAAKINGDKTATSTTPVSDKETKEHNELMAKNCEAAQANVKTLSSNKLVVVEDEQGKARALNPEEHKAQLEKASKDVALYCQIPADPKETTTTTTHTPEKKP